MTPRKSEKDKAEAKRLRDKKAGENFIPRAEARHKADNGTPLYNYTKSIYTKSAEKTTITCKIHGDFLQSPNSHLSGHGCPKCRDDANKANQTMSHEEFVTRCNEKHPNLIDYSKTEYINSKTPIIFICNACRNEYIRDPCHMLGEGRGHGCSTCNGGIRDTLDSFIEKANKTHQNKFNYDLVVYKDSLTKVKIKCKDNHIFEQTPAHHICGNGCPICAGKHRTFEDFKELSKEKYPEIPFDFGTSLFKNMTTPIDIICPRKHTFTIPPSRHLLDDSKGGCIECANISTGSSNSYSQEQWIDLAKSKHHDLWLYDKVVYVNSQTEVIIGCKEHGYFIQIPAIHLGGSGCRKCGNERCAKSKMITEEGFIDRIEQCKEVHNNKYNYNRIYRDDGYLRIEMICDKHGIFDQRLEHHIKGHGCYKCVVNYSKKQIEWLEYRQIRDGFIQHACNIGEYQIPETCMHADGFRKETNTIYEFQGDFWHGNPKIFIQTDINPKTNNTYGMLFERTKSKIKMLISNDYTVIEVWENDWDRGKKAVNNIQNLWRSARRWLKPVANCGAGKE
jgi:hypothetical protein